MCKIVMYYQYINFTAWKLFLDPVVLNNCCFSYRSESVYSHSASFRRHLGSFFRPEEASVMPAKACTKRIHRLWKVTKKRYIHCISTCNTTDWPKDVCLLGGQLVCIQIERPPGHTLTVMVTWWSHVGDNKVTFVINIYLWPQEVCIGLFNVRRQRRIWGSWKWKYTITDKPSAEQVKIN